MGSTLGNRPKVSGVRRHFHDTTYDLTLPDDGSLSHASFFTLDSRRSAASYPRISGDLRVESDRSILALLVQTQSS
jgi:hypothetical protein